MRDPNEIINQIFEEAKATDECRAVVPTLRDLYAEDKWNQQAVIKALREYRDSGEAQQG